MKHDLKREYKGEGITRCITPTCSCGWRGIGYEAHNDWQHTLVKEQELDHLRIPAPRKPKCDTCDDTGSVPHWARGVGPQACPDCQYGACPP